MVGFFLVLFAFLLFAQANVVCMCVTTPVTFLEVIDGDSIWVKKEGEKVSADEPVVELETDKVNLEVPSPVSGVISKINSKDGDNVEVGSILGIVSSGSNDQPEKLQKIEKIPPVTEKIIAEAESFVEEKSKKDIYKSISSNKIKILIGTHSVYNSDVRFKNLGLIIIDEQHKFGVKQRIKLLDKSKFCHTLIMSATPIPRSLSFVIYGEISISDIKTKINGTEIILIKLPTAVRDIDNATSPFANFVKTFEVTPPGAAAIIIKPKAISIGNLKIKIII